MTIQSDTRQFSFKSPDHREKADVVFGKIISFLEKKGYETKTQGDPDSDQTVRCYLQGSAGDALDDPIATVSVKYGENKSRVDFTYEGPEKHISLGAHIAVIAITHGGALEKQGLQKI